MQQQNKKTEKISGNIFMTARVEKIYHIYAKGRCIYHSLSENKFSETWETIHRMIDLLDLNIQKEDLSYEELALNKEVILNSSH